MTLPATTSIDAGDLDRLRLARTDGVGPVLYRRLLARFGNAAAALDALPGLARSSGRTAAPTIPSMDAVRREFDATLAFGARLLFVGRPGYPPMLARLDDAPSVISVLGDAGCLVGRTVAMVGSRNASLNGRRIAEQLALDLAKSGVVVVSGMARGIDAAAHLGALCEGQTVACVAGGLDQPYPPEHAALQERIAASGAVVAEAPLGTAPQARHFPRRNRIIAGLCYGVVVVEAALRSGSLITTRLAIDAGREVLAVPGSPLDARCRGSNDLLRNRATLVEDAADVLAGIRFDIEPFDIGPEEHQLDAGFKETSAPYAGHSDHTDATAIVLDLLGPSPTSVDDLIRGCQLSAATVLYVLVELELADRIENLPGNRVALLIEPGAARSRP